MRKIRKIIRDILPYGFVKAVKEKNCPATFWELYRQYVESGKHCEFKEKSSFKQMISVQGFGFSGASAVIDLLREYDKTIVFGFIGYDNTKAQKNKFSMEVDFLRLAGGLLEFEKYIESHNFFQNDALIQRFMMMAQKVPFFWEISDARELFFEFFKRISFTLRGDMTTWCFNRHLPQADEKHRQLFFLREMTVHEYRKLCREFINSLFSLVEQNNKDLLVLDQFFCDGTYDDYNRNYEYCPNLKTIHVCRDPRDMYAETRGYNLEWPNQTAESFIEWFKIYASGRKIVDTEDYIVVRFEELVLNYDVTVKKIEKYLGLKRIQHIACKTAFDPAISSRSVYLWKKHPEYNEVYRKIEAALPEYLYNN